MTTIDGVGFASPASARPAASAWAAAARSRSCSSTRSQSTGENVSHQSAAMCQAFFADRLPVYAYFGGPGIVRVLVRFVTRRTRTEASA